MRTLKLILSGWQSVGLVVFIMLFFNMEVSGKGKITKNAPVFTQFIYQGEDAIYQNNPLKPGEFYNPILQGCYLLLCFPGCLFSILMIWSTGNKSVMCWTERHN